MHGQQNIKILSTQFAFGVGSSSDIQPLPPYFILRTWPGECRQSHSLHFAKSNTS